MTTRFQRFEESIGSTARSSTTFDEPAPASPDRGDLGPSSSSIDTHYTMEINMPSLETNLTMEVSRKKKTTMPRNVLRMKFQDGEFLPEKNPKQHGTQTHSDTFVRSTVEADYHETSSKVAEQAARDAFEKARQYLTPGPLFRFVINLYGERKFLVFSAVHFVCTMVIWAHFFSIKLSSAQESVPANAMLYWWKILVPPLEFGTIHAMLFQMALVPLTMTRYSIAALSESALNRFIPLSRAVRVHIHLGYTIILTLILSTALFLIFFALLCVNGDEEKCNMLRSEIMATGYANVGVISMILATSCFRHKLPYEVFYSMHHLVFIFYAISIVHTMDDQQTNHEKERAQTFQWFAATLLYYICDRAAMYLNHRYCAQLISSSSVEGSNGSKMLILRLRRPASFSFKPGQYAFLRLASIDSTWHPFSIASGPASSYMEFYIEVFSEDSWTGKLWKILEGDHDDGGFDERQIEVEVLGPCGTSFAKTEDFSHALAIGSGTGIVPILSLYKQHVRQLLRLDPRNHFSDLQHHRKKIIAAEKGEAPRKGCIAKRIANACIPCKTGITSDLETVVSSADVIVASTKDKVHHEKLMLRKEDARRRGDMKTKAFESTRLIYGVVFLALTPVMGVLLLGLTVSWNILSPELHLHPGMMRFLDFYAIFFQSIFALVAIFVWNADQLLAYIDLAVCLVAPFADWHWFLVTETSDGLRSWEIVTFCLLNGYMTVRLWSRTVKPRHKSWRKSVQTDGIGALDSLEIVWVARSASLVSDFLPDVNSIFEALAEQWGQENASKVCRVSIYITDPDLKARELFEREFYGTLLYPFIHFGRPDFAKVVEDHTLKMICSTQKSYSLLAFCGSQKVAEQLHHHKISNDMITAVTGNKDHQMEFIAEVYGGEKNKRPRNSNKSKQSESTADVNEASEIDSLTTRTVISYYPTKSRKFLV